MNNLHRNLAPISDAAWADIEEEAKRTFQRNIAGRRVVDVSGPHGNDFAAVGLGEESAVAGRTAVRPGKHLPGDVAHPRPGEGVVHGVIHGSSLWLCGAPVAPSTTSMRDVSRYVKDISR